MFKKKEKQLYKYKPSFQAKEEPYLIFVKNKIQPLFLKYINNKNSLNEVEHKLIFSEIENIKRYIKKWIVYEIKEDYNKKNNIEKKLEILFYKLKRIYENNLESNFELFFEENLELFIEDSIFESIGILKNDKKVFVPINENSNILYWIHSLVFYKVLDFLENEIFKYENAYCAIDNSSNTNNNDPYLEVETKLEEEDWKKLVKEIMTEDSLKLFIPIDIRSKIEKFLLSLKIKDIEFSNSDKQEIMPYMDILVDILNKKKVFYEEILFF